MLNISRLIPNHSPCTHFWDGFYNFSEREYFIKSVKGKEIQVIEIKNPHARSQIALKIALLFTVIVPLIAAIHYLIRACRFRNCHVTRVSSQEAQKIYQVAQAKMITPEEHQATITHPLATPLHIKQITEEQAVLETAFDTEAFKEAFKEDNLSKLSEYELTVLFEAYGKYLWDKIEETNEEDPELKGLLAINLCPFIFRTKTGCTNLVGSLLLLRHEETINNIQNYLSENPDQVKLIIYTVKQAFDNHRDYLGSAVNFMKTTVIKHFTKERLLQNPNTTLQLFEDDFLCKLLEHACIRDVGIEKILSHKKTTPQSQLRFILNLYKKHQFLPYILEILNTSKYVENLKEAFSDPYFDNIFSNIANINRKWRYYLALMDIFTEKEKLIVREDRLFDGRPQDFDISKILDQPIDKEKVFAIEMIYHVQKKVKMKFKKEMSTIKCEELAKILAKITPQYHFENVLKRLKTLYEFLNTQNEQPKFFPNRFFEHVLIQRFNDEHALRLILFYVLRDFKKYVWVTQSDAELKQFLDNFNLKKVLVNGLYYTLDLPQKRKVAFLQLLSGGILMPNGEIYRIPLDDRDISTSFQESRLNVIKEPIPYNKFCESLE